jgi:hypothetical protein
VPDAIDPRIDPGTADVVASMRRILFTDGVEGFQIEKGRPITVGVKRRGKWHWWFGPFLLAALKGAEAGLRPPAVEPDP